MLKLLFVVFLIGQTYASRASIKGAGSRIINGTAAEEGEFPFAVALRDSSYYYEICGASILNKNFILTAGHCVDCYEGQTDADPSGYNIQYGLVRITDNDTNSRVIKQIYCNNLTEISDGDYYENMYDNAILELESPLPDDGSWAPVTLARVFDATVQHEGVVIGWGDQWGDDYDPYVLQKLTLNVYNDTVCGAATRGHSDHHVCVGGIDGHSGPCFGDSGTAALVDGVQVGSTSYLTVPDVECGHDSETYPNVYARIDKYFDWIQSITPDIQSN